VTPRRRRGRGPGGERGSAIVEFTFLGLLFIVPLLWLMLAVFEVQSASYALTAAVREAGRAFVLAENQSAGMAAARDAARFAVEDHGIALGEVQGFGTPDCGPSGCLQSGSYAEFEMHYDVPLPFFPRVFGNDIASFEVRARHSTPYGDYRESR